MENTARLIREVIGGLTQKSVQDLGRIVRQHGLSRSQFGILMPLLFSDSMNVSEISNQLGISPAAASQLIDKLVQQDLIERTEDPDDRRTKIIKLSGKGKELIKEIDQKHLMWIENLMNEIPQEEREKVLEGMIVLRNSIHHSNCCNISNLNTNEEN